MYIRLPLVPALLVLTIGCTSDEPRAQNAALQAPASIQTSFVDDVVPLADGGAYAVGMDGVWYLSGTAAVRVHPLGDSAARADFESAASLNVQPTADGGAYAVELAGRIWRLEADSAVLVKESSTIPADTTIARRGTDSAGWLLYTRERRQRERTAEDDGAQAEAPGHHDAAEQWR